MNSMSMADWERLKNMSEEDIEQAILDDPDAAYTPPEYRRDERIIQPGDTAGFIDVKVESDILQRLSQTGEDYEVLINRLLRQYFEQEQQTQFRH